MVPTPHFIKAHPMQERITELPTEGFIRQPDLIGAKPVTEQQAQKNRREGKSPVRPRPTRAGIVPFSSATLWRKVKAGQFPKPVKLSPGITAWNVKDVRAWLAAQVGG